MNDTLKDKIAEKVIWENYNPENDSTSISNVALTQQQMMLCYNCNKNIPINSKFCPWCQTELYTECPKCRTKYSSQYPACNQCGTNVKEFLREQEILALRRKKQEEERKYRELEIRRKQEEERRLQEQIRQREIEAQRVLEERRKREEEIRILEAEKRRKEENARQEQIKKEFQRKRIKEDELIRATPEYKEAYAFLNSFYDKVKNQNLKVFIGIFIPLIPMIIGISLSDGDMIAVFVIIGLLVFAINMIFCLKKLITPITIEDLYKRTEKPKHWNQLTRSMVDIMVYNFEYNRYRDKRVELIKAYRESGGPTLV